LDIIESSIIALPKDVFIVDLGCGDARLSQSLLLKGYKVASYDLVATNSYVCVAQCSEKVPLPGDAMGKSSIVDVVVCCLSLMGTDWTGQILESQRILKIK